MLLFRRKKRFLSQPKGGAPNSKKVDRYCPLAAKRTILQSFLLGLSKLFILAKQFDQCKTTSKTWVSEGLLKPDKLQDGLCSKWQIGGLRAQPSRRDSRRAAQTRPRFRHKSIWYFAISWVPRTWRKMAFFGGSITEKDQKTWESSAPLNRYWSDQGDSQ